jgi:hypothetical protein
MIRKMKAVFLMKNHTKVEIVNAHEYLGVNNEDGVLVFRFTAGRKVFINKDDFNHGYLCGEQFGEITEGKEDSE